METDAKWEKEGDFFCSYFRLWFLCYKGIYFFGYKLHVLCELNSVMHSYNFSKASVHDINFLKDTKSLYYDCSIFGDRAYIRQKYNLICLILQILNWNVHIDLIKKTGNQHSCLLQKQEKELKLCSLN